MIRNGQNDKPMHNKRVDPTRDKRGTLFDEDACPARLTHAVKRQSIFADEGALCTKSLRRVNGRENQLSEIRGRTYVRQANPDRRAPMAGACAGSQHVRRSSEP